MKKDQIEITIRGRDAARVEWLRQRAYEAGCQGFFEVVKEKKTKTKTMTSYVITLEDYEPD